ncbi:glycosyltransferase family 2 protein [Chitinilyticum piscinae]|uniref:Glycosyltransferase n=1 Tax=Chitinilyticum piscinae TaxID=2866724 RepID=A0A8J7FQX4_9NEIS|nr:glycosyltransferase family 2 protein [Chitinilyticum piscinae]MBE9609111.1 glycosyltransferase [Chitinilyticum piscinae]
MSCPLVSFVLPCYNAAGYLQETLDSIVRQSYTRWECVAIDDGSTDATLAILQTAARRDPRFRVISRDNRGLIATLNEGIAAAEGEWIARIDADDLCTDDRLERQLMRVQETAADVCGAWVHFFGDRDGEWHLPTSDAGIRAMLLFNSALAHPTVLARRELLLAHPYAADARHAEDYALWCALARAGARFTTVPRVLLHYRTHAGQITQSKRDELRETAMRVRLGYAQWALPVPLQALADRFAELAEPGRLLSTGEFREFMGILRQLAVLMDGARSVLGEVWLDALQRTQGLHAGMLPEVMLYHASMPIPMAEMGKWRKLLLRMGMSDWLWQTLKQVRA